MLVKTKITLFTIGFLICVAIVLAITLPLTVFNKDSNDSTSFGACETVQIHYFSRPNINESQLVRSCDVSDLPSTSFDKRRLNYFGVHGAWDNHKSALFMTDLLKAKDVNLFLIDYEQQAWNTSYYIEGVQEVANIVANFIKLMEQTYDINRNDFVCVGFSLGSHVCGEIGNKLDKNLNAIVALDPPNLSPGFIDSSKSNYVQCISTSFQEPNFPSCHTNIFANEREQPGCNGDSVCNHYRATVYYAESLLTGGFTTTKCDSYENYAAGLCDDNEKSYLGRVDLDKSASGSYYLITNRESPFSQG